jgi:uncharacterized protein (TIGR02145 family)
MSSKKSIWIHLAVVTGMFLMLADSCKKSDSIPYLPATATDADGNVYHEVAIGPQIWMAENLKTTKYRNGDPIPNVADGTAWEKLTSGAYCYYKNDTANIRTFGMLYNWYAVNDSRNIAPAGWHVATDAEWSAMRSWLGGELVAGGKLKSRGTFTIVDANLTPTPYWETPNTGASNAVGFTALPGGYRYYGAVFNSVAYAGYWWSSTAFDSGTAWCRYISNGSAEIFSSHIDKELGFSVRCIKD